MNQRRKGHNLERYIVRRLAEVLGIKAYNPLEPRKGGDIATARAVKAYFADNLGIDVIFSKSSGLYNLGIQCHKHMVKTKEEKIPIAKLKSIGGGKLPILITQLTRKAKVSERETGKYVTMKLEDFEEFLLAYYEKMKTYGE